MKRLLRWGARIILFLLILLTALAGAVTLIPMGYMDFPCFVRHHAEAGCVEIPEYFTPEPEARILVFLNEYQAGWQGAGCLYRLSKEDGLQMRAGGASLDIKRVGGELFLNGTALTAGQSLEWTDHFYPIPWIVSRHQVEYLGKIADCGDAWGGPRDVLLGRYGTYYSPAKGFATLAILIGLFALTFVRRRKPKV